jgi:flagellin
MSSLVTNSAAISALKTLRTVSGKMEETQDRSSSGYRVYDSSDNAAYWSIATTMRSDKAAMATIEEALGLAAATTDTAYNGLHSSIDVLSEIKDKLILGRGVGVDRLKINAELNELKSQLVTIAEASSFSGQNWLYNDDSVANSSVEMAGSFNRAYNGEVAVGVVTFDAATSTLIDTNDSTLGLLTKDTAVSIPLGTTTTTATFFLLDVGAASASVGTEIELGATTADSDIDGMISAVDAMLMSMTTAAANIGAANARIDMSHNFVLDLIETNSKGIGRLVDADITETATRLKALTIQQQLGTQSLSIANANSQKILQMFQGEA